MAELNDPSETHAKLIAAAEENLRGIERVVGMLYQYEDIGGVMFVPSGTLTAACSAIDSMTNNVQTLLSFLQEDHSELVAEPED